MTEGVALWVAELKEADEATGAESMFSSVKWIL
jgi:hypothetical protein